MNHSFGVTEYQVTKVEAGPLLASAGPFTVFMPSQHGNHGDEKTGMSKAWGVVGVEMWMARMGP